MYTLDDCRRLQLPKIHDVRGNLTFVEEDRHVPFEFARAYWLYDVPGGEYRPGHAYQDVHEFIVAISGSFDVIVNDGDRSERFHLSRSYNGVHVPPMIWRRLENFSTNSFALVLASTPYRDASYVRDFGEFCRMRGGSS